MIGKAMQDAINEQINKELFSSYLYLSMVAYFENKNLAGFAHWMRIQEAEEREHAMKFYALMVKVPLTVPSYKKVSAAHHLKPGI